MTRCHLCTLCTGHYNTNTIIIDSDVRAWPYSLVSLFKLYGLAKPNKCHLYSECIHEHEAIVATRRNCRCYAMMRFTHLVNTVCSTLCYVSMHCQPGNTYFEHGVECIQVNASAVGRR